MIDGGMFDTLEALARGIRGNQDAFGGIQLILSGLPSMLAQSAASSSSRQALLTGFFASSVRLIVSSQTQQWFSKQHLLALSGVTQQLFSQQHTSDCRSVAQWPMHLSSSVIRLNAVGV